MRELIRRGAEQLLHPPPALLEEFHTAMLDGIAHDIVTDEPALLAALRHVNEANLNQWITANIHAPGERVAPYVSTDAFDVARDLVRRGLDARALDSYRTSQAIAWRWWMMTCFTLTDDRDELRELLDLTSRSISAYIDDSIEALAVRIDAERDELTAGSHAERMTAVSLLLEGAPIPPARAQAQLGYPLDGDHTAAVLWTEPAAHDEHQPAAEPSRQLEAAAEALMRASDATRRLVIVATAASLWVWLPTATRPREEELARALRATPDVHIAIGRASRDLDGFRRSHLDAVTTQRLLSRLAAATRIAHYDDVQLVALLTGDLARADEFVRDTLGPLATAEPELRHTVSTFVQQQFNTSRTAEMLYTHRNTIVRRLARADELLPRPLTENLLPVAAALDIVRLRGAL